MERMPKQEQAKEDGYDGEAARAEAEQQLREMLETEEVSEDVPQEFVEAVKLRQILYKLDSDTTENSYRHVIELAAETLHEKLGLLGEIKRAECQEYLDAASPEVL